MPSSCQPSVVEISDDNRESERLNNGEPNENVESPESELSWVPTIFDATFTDYICRENRDWHI